MYAGSHKPGAGGTMLLRDQGGPDSADLHGEFKQEQIEPAHSLTRCLVCANDPLFVADGGPSVRRTRAGNKDAMRRRAHGLDHEDPDFTSGRRVRRR